MTTHEITRGCVTVPRREAWQAFHTKLLIGQETNRGSASQRCRQCVQCLESVTLFLAKMVFPRCSFEVSRDLDEPLRPGVSIPLQLIGKIPGLLSALL